MIILSPVQGCCESLANSGPVSPQTPLEGPLESIQGRMVSLIKLLWRARMAAPCPGGPVLATASAHLGCPQHDPPPRCVVTDVPLDMRI